MPHHHSHACPDGGRTDKGQCAGICRECDEHLLLTGRYTPYCPSCDVCPDCGCPNADGFSHYAGCPNLEEEDDNYLEDHQTPEPTYTARWRVSGKPIYTNAPPGNRFGRLPIGAMPYELGPSGDPWDGARFRMPNREEIVVTRDGRVTKLREAAVLARLCRALLVEAKAPRAHGKARSLVKSIEGAIRHEEGRPYRKGPAPKEEHHV